MDLPARRLTILRSWRMVRPVRLQMTELCWRMVRLVRLQMTELCWRMDLPARPRTTVVTFCWRMDLRALRQTTVISSAKSLSRIGFYADSWRRAW